MRMTWEGYVARMGEMRNARESLFGKPEGKRPFGRPRRSWDDNITTDLRGTTWEDVEWRHVAQDRDQWWTLVNTVMNLWVL
jgi:hypothetical protein